MDKELDRWNKQLSSDQQIDYEPLVALISSMDTNQLSKYFARVLPLSLRLLDHHHVPNKMHGVQAISHLLENLPASIRSSTGSDQLLIHSLKNCLVHEEMVLQVLPVLIKCMQRSSIDPLSGTGDDIVLSILRGLDLSSTLSSKQIHWKSLNLVIGFVGLPIIRVCKRVIKRMSDHLSYPLTPESSHMFHELLAAIQSFVRVTEARAHRFSPEVLFAACSFSYSNYEAVRTSDQIRYDIQSLLQTIAAIDATSFQHVVDVVRRNDPENRMSLILQDLACQKQILCHGRDRSRSPDGLTKRPSDVKRSAAVT